MTKGDAGLTKELRKALLETKHCNNWDQLNHLKMTYFKNKQVSVAEATYRLLNGLHLKKSDVSCLFVATGFPENRSKFYAPTKAVEKSSEPEYNDEDGEIEVEENEKDQTFTIPGRQGYYKATKSIHQKYSERPDSDSLKNVCLAQFASSYHSAKIVPKNTEWKNDNTSLAVGQLKQFGTEKYLPKYIKLTSGGFMALKTRPVILRIHASKKKQRHEGIYSELLLFLPWKNETDLSPGDEENCIDLFNQNKEIIENNKRAIYPNSEMIDCMKELLESSEDNRPIHLSDDIDGTGQQEYIFL